MKGKDFTTGKIIYICDMCGEEYIPGSEGRRETEICYDCENDPDLKQMEDDFLFYNQDC